jgi:hypothetical protein
MQYTPRSMAGMNNMTAEIAAADNFPNIRLFTVGQKTRNGIPLSQLASIEQVSHVPSSTSSTLYSIRFLSGIERV